MIFQIMPNDVVPKSRYCYIMPDEVKAMFVFMENPKIFKPVLEEI